MLIFALVLICLVFICKYLVCFMLESKYEVSKHKIKLQHCCQKFFQLYLQCEKPIEVEIPVAHKAQTLHLQEYCSLVVDAFRPRIDLLSQASKP